MDKKRPAGPVLQVIRGRLAYHPAKGDVILDPASSECAKRIGIASSKESIDLF